VYTPLPFDRSITFKVVQKAALMRGFSLASCFLRSKTFSTVRCLTALTIGMALMQKHEGEKGERPAASRCTTKVLEAFDDENQWEQLSPPIFLGYADKGSME